MVLELHHPPASSQHPLVAVCALVAQLCRRHFPLCAEVEEEQLQPLSRSVWSQGGHVRRFQGHVPPWRR